MRGPAATLALLVFFLLAGCNNAAPDLAAYLSAKQRYAAGDLVGSETLLADILRSDRDFSQARLLLGKSQLLLGKFLEAETTLHTLVQDVPAYREAHLWWLRSLIQLERTGEARAALEGLLAWDPDDPRLLLLMAEVAALDGITEEMIAMHARASLYADELARGALRMGRAFYALGEVSRARLAVAEAGRLIAPDSILRSAVAELARLLEAGE